MKPTLPTLLIVDADASRAEVLARAVYDLVSVLHATSAAQALHTAMTQPVAAVVLGDHIDGLETMAATKDQRASRAELCESLGPRAIASGQPAPKLFYYTASREPVSESEPAPLAYVLHQASSADDLRLVIACVLHGRPLAATRRPPAMKSATQARKLQRILELSRQLAAQRDLPGAESVCLKATADLAECDRAYCLFFDADSGAMWSAARAEADGDDERRAITGIAGFAALTGATIAVADVDADCRYSRALDDPAPRARGVRAQRLLAHPIVGADGNVHAVLIGVRSADRQAFSASDQVQIADFAEQAGPLLGQLSLQIEADALIEERDNASLFRPEAVESHMAGGNYGDVVRVSPRWIGWSYWIIVVLLVAGGVYAGIGTVDEYSAGPAVIRMTGRTDVTSNINANLAAITVAPGQEVAKGQLLARFHDVAQQSEVARLEREFATQLRTRMLDPSDASADQSVRSLRVELDRASASAIAREVRAPQAGLISDVRVRAGERISPGQTILSIVEPDSELQVVVLLPGGDRPQLRPGMDIRLEILGYSYAYQTLTIDSVDSDVIGPTEVSRVLGERLADTVRIAGPVAVVRGRLRSRRFTARGRTYSYFDGMQAKAEVRVRSRTILETLIPGLENI